MSLLPIHHTFAPLGDAEQCGAALRRLLQPWSLRSGIHTELLRAELEKTFSGEASLFASGREALLALLQTEHFHAGDEVILQAYTCMVLPNAIQAAGLVPVYADIERDTLNMDMESLEKLLTSRTRAILCQHTFGIPGPLQALRAFCDLHHLLLIEDCAHILPDDEGPAVTAEGDVLLLSFGRDKAISGIAGGAVIARERVPGRGLLKELERGAQDLPRWTVWRLLLYPIIYGFCRPFYRLGIGKLLLALAGKTRLLVPILTKDEKQGSPSQRLHRIPAPCAELALLQWRKRRSINDHRRLLTAFYLQACREHGWHPLAIHADLPLQKFPLFMRNARGMRRNLRRHGLYLDDGWTGCVVCPDTIDLTQARYEAGLDPEAEAACLEILSLPTHPGTSPAQARRAVRALARFIDAV